MSPIETAGRAEPEPSRPHRRHSRPVPGPDESSPRRTVIAMGDDDPLVRIWSRQPDVIRRLRRRPDRFSQIRAGLDGPAEWAEFTTPAGGFVLAAAVRRPIAVSPQRLAELQERGRAARARLHAAPTSTTHKATVDETRESLHRPLRPGEEKAPFDEEARAAARARTSGARERRAFLAGAVWAAGRRGT